MVNLKSVVLGLLTSFFFMLTFTLLFFSILMYFLPADFQTFKEKAEEELPRRIIAQGALDELGEEMRGVEALTGEEFQLMLVALQTECRQEESRADAALCEAIAAGEIRTKQDFIRFFNQQTMEPALREGVRDALGRVESWIVKAEGFLPLVIVGFLISFGIASLLLYWEHAEGFLHAMLVTVNRSLFMNLLSVLSIWLLVPFSAGWLAEQVGGIAMAQLAEEAEGVPVQALVEIVVEFFLEEMRTFLFKPLVVYAVLAGAMWAGTKVTKTQR